MNLKLHTELLEDIFDKVREVRLQGQEEYAQNKANVFANFDRIAELQGLSPEQVLMTYLLKHIDGIQSYVKGHRSQREDVRGRIVDIIVYLTLLWGMVDHEEELVEMLEKQEIDKQVSAEAHLSRGEWPVNEPTIEERYKNMEESEDGEDS